MRVHGKVKWKTKQKQVLMILYAVVHVFRFMSDWWKIASSAEFYKCGWSVFRKKKKRTVVGNGVRYSGLRYWLAPEDIMALFKKYPYIKNKKTLSLKTKHSRKQKKHLKLWLIQISNCLIGCHNNHVFIKNIYLTSAHWINNQNITWSMYYLTHWRLLTD